MRQPRACTSEAFCKMSVILCGRFYSNDVAVASYGNRIRAKYTLKWGVQIMGSHFGASSEEYSKKEGEST